MAPKTKAAGKDLNMAGLIGTLQRKGLLDFSKMRVDLAQAVDEEGFYSADGRILRADYRY